MRKKIAAVLRSLATAIGGSAYPEFDDLFEELMQEDRRRTAEGLDVAAPNRWRSYYYMKQGYRVRNQDKGQNHWRGGAPHHDGAECPACEKPLLLFWDIDCRDKRFKLESPELFGEMERLPLYYCCRHPEPTCYQILPDDGLKTFAQEPVAGEESPFQGFPDAWERRPIALEAIPRDIEKLLVIERAIDSDWLNAEEQEWLKSYIAPRVFSEFSQFGGVPSMVQGHELPPCPNPECLTHRMGSTIGRHERQYRMKELAVIDSDAEFEMETDSSQIAFHICWKCLTIQGAYRCT